MWVEVEVELANGKRVASRCHGPRGFWGLLPLSRDEHLTKVRDCLEMRLTRDQAERCIQLAEKLDELGADEVQELVTLTSC